MIYLISLSIIMMDQIIKMIVSTHIPYGTSIGSWIKITNISNTGMAFGMRTKQANNYNHSKYCNYKLFIKVFYKKL